MVVIGSLCVGFDSPVAGATVPGVPVASVPVVGALCRLLLWHLGWL